MVNYDDTVNNEKVIKKYLTVSGLSFEFFDTVSSTNDLAKEMAKNGKDEGAVIIANSQTSGRGRQSRRF